MQLYRLTRTPYARDLSGDGARRYGGRWNPKGTAILYTTNAVSLAVLETMVHLPTPRPPRNLSLAVLDVPDSLKIQSIEHTDLPTGWGKHPAPKELIDMGFEWATKGESVGLEVPPAIIPPQAGERNVLLNPAHPHFAQVRILEVTPFSLDDRLFKS